MSNSLSRRSFVAGVAATGALTALGLSGCAKEEPAAPVTETEAPAEDEAPAEEPAAPAGGTRITAANAYSSTNYNPVNLNGGSALMLAATHHVFEGLYDLDFHTYETYPALAAGDPVAISDTEYEVTLREGALFSDGTPVTIEDVIWSFEQNMAEGALCASFLPFIEEIAKKDDTTVTFKLKYPFESLLTTRLACVMIVPASSTDEQLASMPIGSGPWMYEALNGDDGGQIDFIPNPNYNGPKPATADAMTWYPKKDDTARTTALQEGTVMVAESIPAPNIEMLQAAGVTVEAVQGFGIPFLMFNTLKAPLNDKRVRQAFFYALNYDMLIANGVAGLAAPAESLLPTTHPNFNKAATVFTYDPEKAKALLKEAGAESFKIRLDCNNNWVSALGAQIKNDLDAVGIETELNTNSIDWATMAPTEDGSAPELEYDVVLTPGDPTCFSNDPDLIMSWWFADNAWTQGRTCWKFADGSFDTLQDLMDQARQASGADQQALWNQCYDILADEVPLYPLFHRQIPTGWREELIEDFAPIATTGLIFHDATPKA